MAWYPKREGKPSPKEPPKKKKKSKRGKKDES